MFGITALSFRICDHRFCSPEVGQDSKKLIQIQVREEKKYFRRSHTACAHQLVGESFNDVTAAASAALATPNREESEFAIAFGAVTRAAMDQVEELVLRTTMNEDDNFFKHQHWKNQNFEQG